MTVPITIGMLNYRRPENVRQIIAMLRCQPVRCHIFLWDNGFLQLDSGTAPEFSGVDWLVRSSTNAYCWPRWFMLANAQTEFALTLDDDLGFGPNALATIVDELARLEHENQILGPEGVLLGASAPYFSPPGAAREPGFEQSLHLHAGTSDIAVDIVKGRSMAMRVSALRARLPLFVGRDEICDDIAVSALLAGSRKRAHRLPAAFHRLFIDLPGKNGPMALSARSDWQSIRNEARNRYFSREISQ